MVMACMKNKYWLNKKDSESFFIMEIYFKKGNKMFLNKWIFKPQVDNRMIVLLFYG